MIDGHWHPANAVWMLLMMFWVACVALVMFLLSLAGCVVCYVLSIPSVLIVAIPKSK